jgi:hypothetical protein
VHTQGTVVRTQGNSMHAQNSVASIQGNVVHIQGAVVSVLVKTVHTQKLCYCRIASSTFDQTGIFMPQTRMRYWWVNHKQTFDHEIGNGYIWCPKRKKDGGRNHFYETLREVQQGDIIFSYAHACLQALGVAKLPCYSCPRPDEFGSVGNAWNVRGWRVDVMFQRFQKPLRIASIANQIAHLLPASYSPIRSNGHGNQGAYLAEISKTFAQKLVELTDPLLLPIINQNVVFDEAHSSISDPVAIVDWEDALQLLIHESASIPETMRSALIYARRGQGKFKQNVAQIERSCRITKVANRTHLIASHIKPWRESSNEERLLGANGLLLTPSIDHLFDWGFISFEDNGEVIVSPIADQEALHKMGIECHEPLFTGKFHSDQCHFLDYHRKEIFLKSAV